MRRSIYANYLGALLSVAAPIVALPYYLHLLGPKLFGLISFVATVQVVLTLLDSGIAQIAVREFSIRLGGLDRIRTGAAELLFNLEKIYWAVAISAGVLTGLAASVISNHWLRLELDILPSGTQAVIGAAALFTVQFPGSLYRSFLVASQAQVRLNVILVSGLFARHAGAILLLTYFPSILTYLMWHTFVALLDTGTRAWAAWGIVKIRRDSFTWKYDSIRTFVPAAARLSGAILLGSLGTQVDKIILSTMVPIEQFGYYAVASTLSAGVLNLVYPLMQAYSPRIMQFSGRENALRSLNIKLTAVISALILVGGCAFLLWGNVFLHTWLGKPVAEATIHQLLSILLVGSAMNALYHVGYYTWLAKGTTNRIFAVNAVSLLLSILLVPILVNRYGMIGATFGFVTMNLIGLFASLEWITKRGT